MRRPHEVVLIVRGSTSTILGALYFHAHEVSALNNYGLPGLREKAHLPVQGHEIEVVPSLNNLSFGDPNNRDSGKLDRRPGPNSSQKLTFVLSTHGAARSDFVTFSNHVLDDNYHVWEGFAEQCVKRSEVLRTLYRVRRIIRQTVSDAVCVEHLLDRAGSSLIPDFLKP